MPSNNYTPTETIERDLALKKKIVELEGKLEKVLQKSNYKSSESERLASLGKKYSVRTSYLTFNYLVFEKVL